MLLILSALDIQIRPNTCSWEVTPENELSAISILMSSSDAISDMARSGFLDWPTTNKDISDKKTSLFHDSPEELYITTIMCALQEALATRQINTDAMYICIHAKQ